MVKNLPTNARRARDTGLIAGSGRYPGIGNATCSSIPAWKSPWTDEPARLQAVWLQKVGHDSVSECNYLPRILAVCEEG